MPYFALFAIILFLWMQNNRLRSQIDNLERENRLLQSGYLGPQQFKAATTPNWKKWFPND